jgi:hypothetical protein
MVLVKHQTLLRGFPNWDVSRVWSETTSKAVFGAQFWCLWVAILIGISQNGRCVQIEIVGCQAQNGLKASINGSKIFDMVLHGPYTLFKIVFVGLNWIIFTKLAIYLVLQLDFICPAHSASEKT